MYCIKCGSEISENDTVCPSCGAPVKANEIEVEETKVEETVVEEAKVDETVEETKTEETVAEDTTESSETPVEENTTTEVVEEAASENDIDFASNGLAAGSLIFPPFGIIYGLLTKKLFPNKGKTAIKAALIGIVVYLIAGLTFYFIVLPIEKRWLLKYECEYNTPGSTYNYNNYTCTHPDGSVEQKIPKDK